ncbi:MAG: PHP domain-containing protein [Anaerolineae bacterium]
MRADLHIHTTASDGCWTPERVIEGVQAAKIGLFAVTDHDTTANVYATKALARAAGIAFLRGVEVSTMDRNHNSGEMALHILGYGIDPENPVLQSVIRQNDDLLKATDDTNIRELIRLGYAIDLDDYVNYEYDHTRGGWRSLNYLIDQGICADVGAFFRKLWPQMTHRWPDFAHPAEAIAAIRTAGGVPILAHPGASFDHDGFTEEDLNTVLDYGIAGVECYSYAHDAAMTALCVDWCQRHDLLITGGSDYHGGFAGRALGVPVVELECLHLGELEDVIIT